MDLGDLGFGAFTALTFGTGCTLRLVAEAYQSVFSMFYAIIRSI